MPVQPLSELQRLVSRERGKPQRIILHWTAGKNTASAIDRSHYHFVVEGSGNVVGGLHSIEDNDTTKDGDYAAHTLGCNTRSIGIGLCGMMGAKESPFTPGQYPVNAKQLAAACQLIALLCHKYDIKPTKQLVLTHAEVQPNLGITQRGKWDITHLPWAPHLQGARACGDYIRDLVRQAMTAESEPIRPSQVRNVMLNDKKLVTGFLEDGETLVPVQKTVAALQAAGYGLKLVSPLAGHQPGQAATAAVLYSTVTSSDKVVWIDGLAYAGIRFMADLLDLKVEYDTMQKAVVLSPFE